MPPGRGIGLHRQACEYRPALVPPASVALQIMTPVRRAARLPRAASTPFMDNRVTILLVDDQPRNLDALEAILDPGEYRFVRAQSADEALLALLQGEFAAIVLD